MTTILLSYNEVQALARKAAGGAGLPHGVAEDIGRAAVWLSARGVDAIRVVVDTIAGDEKRRPSILAGQAAVDALCCGEMDHIVLGDRKSDLLLIGLAGATATETGLNLAAVRGDGEVLPLAEISNAAGLIPSMAALRLLPEENAKAVVSAGTWRPAASDGLAYDAALALAAKTYVPASEQSRVQGAGAGITDND